MRVREKCGRKSVEKKKGTMERDVVYVCESVAEKRCV